MPQNASKDLRNSLQATILIFGFRCTGRGCGCGLSFIPRPNPQSQRNTRTLRSCEVCRSGKLYVQKKIIRPKEPLAGHLPHGDQVMASGWLFFLFSEEKKWGNGSWLSKYDISGRTILAGRHEMTSLSSCWTALRWGWNLAQKIWEVRINTPLFQRPTSASISVLNSSLIFFF